MAGNAVTSSTGRVVCTSCGLLGSSAPPAVGLIRFRGWPGHGHPPETACYINRRIPRAFFAMSHRLSKITTRTGDKGDTGLGDGSRVPKDSVRIAALGDVDELNSSIGLLLSEPLPDDVCEALVAIQHDLFDLGGEVAVPGYTSLTPRQIERIEDQLERWN